jgi:hypothetical protein
VGVTNRGGICVFVGCRCRASIHALALALALVLTQACGGSVEGGGETRGEMRLGGSEGVLVRCGLAGKGEKEGGGSHF